MKDGDFWVIGRRGPGKIDQVLVDPYSFVHLTSGFILAWLGLTIEYAVLLFVLWEIFENSPIGTMVWRTIPKFWPFKNRLNIIDSQANYVGDSIGNIISDIIFGIIGFYLFGVLF